MSRKKNRQYRRHNPGTKLAINSAYGMKMSSPQTIPLNVGAGYLRAMNFMFSGTWGTIAESDPRVSELEIVKKPEPVIGYKIINVDYHRPYWEIQTNMGVNHEDGIPANRGIARCGAVANTDPHRDYDGDSLEHKPQEFASCACGFYAMKSYKRVSQEGWLAKVRLYGMVVEATNGYRATKQDILEVWPPIEMTGAAHMEQLKEQFPTVIWHLPDHNLVQSFTPKEMAQEVTHIHMDPLYDILPAEVIDNLLPNQQYVYTLPFMKNMSMALIARIGTNNQGITFELCDYSNTRILGPIQFSGTRYHWYGPDGKPINRH